MMYGPLGVVLALSGGTEVHYVMVSLGDAVACGLGEVVILLLSDAVIEAAEAFYLLCQDMSAPQVL